jgi:hypothetical protein
MSPTREDDDDIDMKVDEENVVEESQYRRTPVYLFTSHSLMATLIASLIIYMMQQICTVN